MKIIDYVILFIIAALLILAVIYLIKHKKNGCHGCNMDCSSCKKRNEEIK